MAKQERFKKDISLKNRKASFDYEFLDTYTAGIQLRGTEIKSIRESKVSFHDAFCVFFRGELYVRNLHIAPYTEATHFNHEETRDRKLLLKKQELSKIEAKTEDKGLTIIPTRIFINDRGLAKINIAVARGKKKFDKRESIKEKDVKRELQRMKL